MSSLKYEVVFLLISDTIYFANEKYIVEHQKVMINAVTAVMDPSIIKIGKDALKM